MKWLLEGFVFDGLRGGCGVTIHGLEAHATGYLTLRSSAKSADNNSATSFPGITIRLVG